MVDRTTTPDSLGAVMSGKAIKEESNIAIKQGKSKPIKAYSNKAIKPPSNKVALWQMLVDNIEEALAEPAKEQAQEKKTKAQIAKKFAAVMEEQEAPGPSRLPEYLEAIKRKEIQNYERWD